MSSKTKQIGADILNDPIVRQMMRADGVTYSELSQLLATVASTLECTPERPYSRIAIRRAIRTAAIVSRIPLA